MDNQSREVLAQTQSGAFVCGLGIPSRFSPCKTHSRQLAQSSGFDPMLKVKTCIYCKMFDAGNWVAPSNGEDGPGGSPSHETLSVAYQGALEISSVVGRPSSLVRDHFSSPRVVTKPCQCEEGSRPSPKDHNIQIFTNASNEGWGTHLEQVCDQTGNKGYT